MSHFHFYTVIIRIDLFILKVQNIIKIIILYFTAHIIRTELSKAGADVIHGRIMVGSRKAQSQPSEKAGLKSPGERTPPLPGEW